MNTMDSQCSVLNVNNIGNTACFSFLLICLCCLSFFLFSLFPLFLSFYPSVSLPLLLLPESFPFLSLILSESFWKHLHSHAKNHVPHTQKTLECIVLICITCNFFIFLILLQKIIYFCLLVMPNLHILFLIIKAAQIMEMLEKMHRLDNTETIDPLEIITGNIMALSLSKFLYVSYLFVCMCTHRCGYMYICVHLYIVHKYVYLCIYINTYICINIYVYVLTIIYSLLNI